MDWGTLPEHSPLGGSGAHRWMVCPGSVSLSEGVDDPESDDAALGTAAHKVGEQCLRDNEKPTTLVGKEVYKGITCDDNMAEAVQFYLDEIRMWHPHWRRNQRAFVEHRFHCPDLHPLFYGAADFVYLKNRLLDVWDYKHGIGIVIEADENPQCMYYACGVLQSLQLWDKVVKVRIHIAQPRGWHWQGPHRIWEVSVKDLKAWLQKVLLPAMARAEVSRNTKSGSHCRFCPARQGQCPALMEDMVQYQRLLMKADGRGVEALTNEQLGQLLNLHEIAKIVIKAANTTAFGKLSAGAEVPNLKLVKARSHRVFKKGAEKAAKREFGDSAYTEPQLKSPAQVEAMPGGKEFAARWAFKPDTSVTVAVDSDPRAAIKRGARALFTPVKGD